MRKEYPLSLLLFNIFNYLTEANAIRQEQEITDLELERII